MKKNTGSFVKKNDDDRNLVTPTLPNKMEKIKKNVRRRKVDQLSRY